MKHITRVQATQIQAQISEGVKPAEVAKMFGIPVARVKALTTKKAAPKASAAADDFKED